MFILSMLKHCTKEPAYTTLLSEARTTTGSMMIQDETMRDIDETEMQVERLTVLALKNA